MRLRAAMAVAHNMATASAKHTARLASTPTDSVQWVGIQWRPSAPAHAPRRFWAWPPAAPRPAPGRPCPPPVRPWPRAGSGTCCRTRGAGAAPPTTAAAPAGSGGGGARQLGQRWGAAADCGARELSQSEAGGCKRAGAARGLRSGPCRSFRVQLRSPPSLGRRLEQAECKLKQRTGGCCSNVASLGQHGAAERADGSMGSSTPVPVLSQAAQASSVPLQAQVGRSNKPHSQTGGLLACSGISRAADRPHCVVDCPSSARGTPSAPATDPTAAAAAQPLRPLVQATLGPPSPLTASAPCPRRGQPQSTRQRTRSWSGSWVLLWTTRRGGRPQTRSSLWCAPRGTCPGGIAACLVRLLCRACVLLVGCCQHLMRKSDRKVCILLRAAHFRRPAAAHTAQLSER